MTDLDRGAEVAVLSTTVNTEGTAYVDWPAVIAGAVMASAISFVLFAFGTGIGLSITSPYPPESVSAATFAIVLSLWILVVTIVSFLAGGYFTGLLIRRYATGEHEREMRDGMHGALAWALGVILGASLTALTVAVAAKPGSEATATYFADVLLRSDNPATVAPAETESRRNEVTRIFMRNPTGDVSPDDRAYLSKLVMHQSGIPEPEAKARVDTVVGRAQAAAEKARKFALLLAFAIAATLALGFAVAWWAAVQGGEHRDQGFDFRPHIGWKGRLRDFVKDRRASSGQK